VDIRAIERVRGLFAHPGGNTMRVRGKDRRAIGVSATLDHVILALLRCRADVLTENPI